jgi:signal transduction histidine kinase
MAWVIGSNKAYRSSSQALRWRLLLSYLAVMLTILGAFTVAMYEFSRRSLYDQLDQRLKILAQAASHSLVALKAGDRQQADSQPKKDSDILYRRLDGDGDLDIPWQSLREPDQGVEWFDAKGQLVGNAGTLLLNLPPDPSFQTLQQGQIRAVTIAAYSYDNGRQKLEGYIRTSEVTQEVEAILNRLRWGLGVGGIVVLGLTGLGGVWLTKQSLKPIEQSFQQLKQFTADASHELRSPLAAIKTSVEVMQYYPERIHPQDTKKLAAIASATRQMTRLVEDLLLLARMDAVTVTQQEFIPLPLEEILEDLMEMLQPQAQQKNVTLQSNLLSGMLVLGDVSQLTRLFTNLLENALQYTPPEGTVTLSMQRIERSVAVYVEDTGIGIAPEQLTSVFHRFWRADRARSHREGGMGLGLAIAAAIAQRHQGEISVSSQLGVGSSFRVRLPLADNASRKQSR